MTSLFHDFAYQYELEESNLIEIKDLDSLHKKFNIENFLLEEKIDGISKKLFSCCKDYFIYRRDFMNRIDHGVFAGIYLYDRLVKIRQRKETEINDPLYWGKELEKQYALASASIAMHNIWMPKKTDEVVYKRFNLDKLIKFEPLKSKDHPLLYLLGIVDTLEPIKLFLDIDKGIDEKYIFDNLQLEFKVNSITFQASKAQNWTFKN